MTSDEIKIVKDAAQSDINKIREAIAKLEDSKNSVSRLKSASSAMRGQTGQAIAEQSEKLEAKIGDSSSGLINQLNSTIKSINAAVQWYVELDVELQKEIQAKAGIN